MPDNLGGEGVQGHLVCTGASPAALLGAPKISDLPRPPPSVTDPGKLVSENKKYDDVASTRYFYISSSGTLHVCACSY